LSVLSLRQTGKLKGVVKCGTLFLYPLFFIRSLCCIAPAKAGQSGGEVSESGAIGSDVEAYSMTESGLAARSWNIE